MALTCHFTQIAGGESAAAHQPLLWTQTAFWSELEMQQEQNSRTRARTNRQEDRFAGISKAGSSDFFLLTVRLLTGIKPYGKDNAAWAHPQITPGWEQQHSVLSPGYSGCLQNLAKPQKLGNAGPAYRTSLVSEHTKGKLVLFHSHMCTNNRSNLFYRAWVFPCTFLLLTHMKWLEQAVKTLSEGSGSFWQLACPDFSDCKRYVDRDDLGPY